MSNLFAEMSDEEIAQIAQRGNAEATEYLLDKYKGFVKTKARSFFLVGADHEDIVQEGMIGLYKAIRDYDPVKLPSFRSFAEICVQRQIITAVKMATRQKHVPLNTYVSLYQSVYRENEKGTLLETISARGTSDPAELIIDLEEYWGTEKRINQQLTRLESRVLAAYLEGKNYEEIGKEVGRHAKSVDNALQRVKHKLEIAWGYIDVEEEKAREAEKRKKKKEKRRNSRRKERKEICQAFRIIREYRHAMRGQRARADAGKKKTEALITTRMRTRKKKIIKEQTRCF